MANQLLIYHFFMIITLTYFRVCFIFMYYFLSNVVKQQQFKNINPENKEHHDNTLEVTTFE